VERERVVEFVSGTDEERAHLRLLLRILADRLLVRWRWGTEDTADLLLVDQSQLGGEMARTRAIESGVRCVMVTSTPGAVHGDLLLPRPFKADDLRQVLDAASEASKIGVSTIEQGAGFFDEPEHTESNTDWQSGLRDFDFDADAPTWCSPPGVDEAQALFRRDPSSNKPSTLMPDPLDPRTAIEWTGEAGERAQLRIGRIDGSGVESLSTNIDPALRRFAPRDDTWHHLIDFLHDAKMGGPSRIAPPNLPALVLDPKEHVFHTAGNLPSLEPYCRLMMKRSYWVPLTNGGLAGVRESQPAQPYHRLRWLAALLKGDGHLARHLDPGGVYRLRRWLKIAQDYPRAYRISATMLRPARLHEIAAASAMPMAEVFDVVNAWDAIGYLECQPRESLRQGGSGQQARR